MTGSLDANGNLTDAVPNMYQVFDNHIKYEKAKKKVEEQGTCDWVATIVTVETL